MRKTTMFKFTLIISLLVGPGLAGRAEPEFAQMFNGKDLAGWHTTGNWVVETNNIITLKPRPGEHGWKRYNDYLTTDRKYGNFVLDLEFKFNAGGNSGAFMRIGDLKDHVTSGFEVQILDTYGKKNVGNHDCGGVIGTAGPTKNMVKPAGEWNRYTITLIDHSLTVVLNGEQIIDLDLSKSRLKDRPAEGYISFQDEGKQVWYRNVRIAPVLSKTPKPKQKPNFVVIFIDDMGYGDIEPFGSTANKTPHLNRMAEEGLKFTSFYVAAPVCTPSRAALITGCYPKRVGLATGSWSVVLFPKDPHGLNRKEKTIARVLKDAGYATGCFGKWHLGDQPEFLPTNYGFDTYFGIPYSNDMWPSHPPAKRWKNGVCPLPVMRGDKVVDIVKDMDDQAQLCKRFTDEVTKFIRENKDKPFFVYLPHAFVHHPRRARKVFMDKANGNATRAQIEEVDWSTGQILDTIRELGLGKDTLVIFTSDNGGAGGCSSKPLRGGKGSTWEGGMREPTIAWWPGTIPANSTCDEIATTMDLLPTFAKLGDGKVPDDRVIDGKDITALLRDPENAQSPHKAFFYYSRNNLQAVRAGEWKLHTNGQLYNLDQDIGEKKNVAKDNPEVVARLNKLLDDCRADLDDPKNCRPVGKNMNPKYLVPPEAPQDSNK